MIADSTEAKEMWPIDAEWMNLVLRAREMGLTIDEIRDFLQGAVSLETE